MAEENLYQWTDNPTASGVAICDTDVLNDCLMHLKYERGGASINDKITNCLLEVPQNIKLELNDGVLTLKAGSKVIVPNGFETDGTTPKFDEMVIDSDLTVGTTGGTGQTMIAVQGNGYANSTGIHNCISGSNAEPQAYSLVYNTTNNTIIRYSSDPSTGGTRSSLPIAICTQGETHVITSIDQVFNGMGYIGSTIWVDKGVKGLIPNGRNEDGTLRNIESTNTKLTKITVGPNQTNNSIRFMADGLGFGNLFYKEDTNYNYPNANYTETRSFIEIAKFSSDANSQIQFFQPKLPVHLVDRNEFEEVIAITESYVNGTSGYRVYSNGFCEQWGRADTGTANGSTVNVTLLRKYKDTNGYCLVTSNKITFPGGGGVTYGTSGAYFVDGSTIQISVGASGGNPKQWFTGGYLA